MDTRWHRAESSGLASEVSTGHEPLHLARQDREVDGPVTHSHLSLAFPQAVNTRDSASLGKREARFRQGTLR